MSKYEKGKINVKEIRAYMQHSENWYIEGACVYVAFLFKITAHKRISIKSGDSTICICILFIYFKNHSLKNDIFNLYDSRFDMIVKRGTFTKCHHLSCFAGRCLLDFVIAEKILVVTVKVKHDYKFILLHVLI